MAQISNTQLSIYRIILAKNMYRNLTRNFIVTMSRKLTRLPTPAVLVLRWTEQIKSILHNLYNSDKTRLTFSIQMVFQKMHYWYNLFVKPSIWWSNLYEYEYLTHFLWSESEIRIGSKANDKRHQRRLEIGIFGTCYILYHVNLIIIDGLDLYFVCV